MTAKKCCFLILLISAFLSWNCNSSDNEPMELSDWVNNLKTDSLNNLMYGYSLYGDGDSRNSFVFCLKSGDKLYFTLSGNKISQTPGYSVKTPMVDIDSANIILGIMKRHCIEEFMSEDGILYFFTQRKNIVKSSIPANHFSYPYGSDTISVVTIVHDSTTNKNKLLQNRKPAMLERDIFYYETTSSTSHSKIECNCSE